MFIIEVKLINFAACKNIDLSQCPKLLFPLSHFLLNWTGSIFQRYPQLIELCPLLHDNIFCLMSFIKRRYTLAFCYFSMNTEKVCTKYIQVNDYRSKKLHLSRQSSNRYLNKLKTARFFLDYNTLTFFDVFPTTTCHSKQLVLFPLTKGLLK